MPFTEISPDIKLDGEEGASKEDIFNVNDIIGEMLVKRGILTVDQFNAYKGQYIRYIYLKHVLGLGTLDC